MNWFEFNFVTLRVIMRYKIKKRREKKNNIGLKRIFFLILSPLLINLTYRCQLKKYYHQGNEGKKLYYKVIKILFIFHFFGMLLSFKFLFLSFFFCLFFMNILINK